MAQTDLACVDSTHSVWETLVKRLQAEPHIMGSRISAENLQRIYDQGLAVMRLHDGMPVAFIAAWPVADRTVEVGSAWVDPQYRGRGWGTKLVREIAAVLTRRKLQGFAVSDSPPFIAAARRVGLHFCDDWRDPMPYALTCGPCEKRRSDEEKRTCPYRNRDCHLILF